MPSGGYVLDAAGLAAIVSFFMSFFKPALESLPWARPKMPLHDWTLQAFYILLNALAVVAQAEATHTFAPQAGENVWTVAMRLVLQVVTMSSVGTVGYVVVTRFGKSVGDSSKGATPVPSSNLATSVSAGVADDAQPGI